MMARRRKSEGQIASEEADRKLAESIGGKWVRRGGKRVLLTKKIVVDTTVLTEDYESHVTLEYYHNEEQWHGSHEYERHVGQTIGHGTYVGSGCMNTLEVGEYLAKLKGDIAKTREGLNILESDLIQVARAL